MGNRLKFGVLGVATAFAIGLGTLPASADTDGFYGTINVSWVSSNSSTVFNNKSSYQGFKAYHTSWGGTRSGSAGLFAWNVNEIKDDDGNVLDVNNQNLVKLTHDKLYTFCIEFVENIKSPTEYALVDPSLAPEANIPLGAMGEEKRDLLQKWFGAYYGQIVDRNTAAAFQAGVWEIVYEDLDLIGVDVDANGPGVGSFKLWNNSNLSTTQAWFDDPSWMDADGVRLMALSSPNANLSGGGANNRQDQITISMVPTPTAMLGGVFGLACLGMRRRSR